MRKLLLIALFLFSSPVFACSATSGTYSGNGTSQSITGLGFSTANGMVEVKDTSTQSCMWSQKGMTAGQSITCDGTSVTSTTAITSRDADGFSVGAANTVNQNGHTYYWFAVLDDSKNDCEIGTYTGNGSAGRILTLSNSFTIGSIMVIGVGNDTHGDNIYFTNSALAPTTNAARLAGTAALQGGEITALSTNTFTVGSDDGTNANTGIYGYIAFKQGGGTTDAGTYTGNGSDDRNVSYGTALNGIADWVITKTGGAEGAQRMNAEVGDDSGYFSPIANAANRLQSQGSKTTFQIGTSGDVNTNTSLYYYFAIYGDQHPATASSFSPWQFSEF